MAGDFDGTDYVGMDGTRLGDGLTDQTTQPLSTYVENRLDGNTRHLVQKGSEVTKVYYSRMPPTPSGGEPAGGRGSRRLIGNVNQYAIGWTSIMQKPLPITSNLNKITARILCEIGNVKSTEHRDLTIQLRLHELGPGGREYTKEIKKTGAGLGTLLRATVELDLSDEDLNDRSIGLVSIWISDGNGGGLPTGATQNLKRRTAGFKRYYNSNATFASEISNGDCYVQGGNSKGAVYNQDGTNRILGVHSLHDTENGGFETVFPAFITPHSVALDYEYDDDDSARRYSPKLAPSCRAQEPVQGTDAGLHSRNMDGVGARPRCLAVGPDGSEPQDTDHPTNWRNYWRWTLYQADSGNIGGWSGDLDSQCIQIPKNSGRIVVYAFITAWIDYGIDLISTDKWGSAKRDADLTLNAFVGGEGAQQVLQDFELYPIQPTPSFHLPNTVYHGLWDANSTRITQRHAFFEGQIFEDDIPLLRLVRIEIPYSEQSKGSSVHLKLELDAVTNGGDQVDDVCIINHGSAWYEAADV